MELYEKALEVTSPPTTLESFLAWEELANLARGEEAERIGELFEVMVMQSPDAFEQYQLHGIEQEDE